jgi:hypothetical protein
MTNRVAAVVTINDLANYFVGVDKGWTQQVDGEEFEALSHKLNRYVKFKLESVLFHVHIESVDDSNDSHDVTTDKPIKEITEFLSEGIPGGEYFKKMSFGPNKIASLLKYAANHIQANMINRSQLSAIIRRISVMTLSIGREIVDIMEIPALKKEMEKKGWKVKQKENDVGIPYLEVDISGIYIAKIVVSDTWYSYEFAHGEIKKLDEEGTTDDPIDEYEVWVRKILKEKEEMGGTQTMPSLHAPKLDEERPTDRDWVDKPTDRPGKSP